MVNVVGDGLVAQCFGGCFALTIRDTTNPYSLVIYYAELFEIVNDQEDQIGSGSIALVPGKTQETYLFETTFETTGQKTSM